MVTKRNHPLRDLRPVRVNKKCLFCGRFFNPDPRVKNQKACWREQCKKARQQLAFSNWCKRNPRYFEGRYSYVKEWRKTHKKKRFKRQKSDDTKRVPVKNSIFKWVLLLPGTFRGKVIQNEISLKRIGRSTFFATGYR
jgi:hypothetical protein